MRLGLARVPPAAPGLLEIGDVIALGEPAAGRRRQFARPGTCFRRRASTKHTSQVLTSRLNAGFQYSSIQSSARCVIPASANQSHHASRSTALTHWNLLISLLLLPILVRGVRWDHAAHVLLALGRAAT